MGDTYIEEDDTYVRQIYTRDYERDIRSKFIGIKKLVNNLNKIFRGEYFYIGGGYLRDIIAGLPTKDIDIFNMSENGNLRMNNFMNKKYEKIYESVFVDRYKSQNNIFDISKVTDKSPHRFIYDVDFINSGIVYDSNHCLFYHQDFYNLTINRILKLNSSVSINNDSRMIAFRMGKFIERGYKYHSGNFNNFFDEIEEIKEKKTDIVVIKND